MKRIIAVLFIAFTGLSTVIAQDVISLKADSGEIKARIIQLHPKDVIFIPENSLDTAYLPRGEVAKLQYGSGITIYLSGTEIRPAINEQGIDSLFIQGETDAGRYYKGYKPAAIGTMITSVFFPFGLIPAIACSATPPSMNNLGYKDPKLMEISSYYNGYTKTSHEIKKRKVWGGFGIGSGFIIVMTILLSTAAVTTL